jgi:hypothetical protein
LEDTHAYHNHYSGTYGRNGTLDTLYDFLIELGYEMSDEEKALRDGTHELFPQFIDNDKDDEDYDSDWDDESDEDYEDEDSDEEDED